jgi:hypothetical protein
MSSTPTVGEKVETTDAATVVMSSAPIRTCSIKSGSCPSWPE